MLRNALVLAILAISTPVLAADSDTASKLDSWDGWSLLAFAILFVGFARLIVRDKSAEPQRTSS
jgi:hypothetical protein